MSTLTTTPPGNSEELAKESNWEGFMGSTCQEMHETGYAEWGFVIYRCAYGDDALWDRYMKYFKEQIHDKLVDQKCEFMEKYARWTVVEDEADLQGASKLQVRRRFVEWRDRHCVWRPGQPWFEKNFPDHLPDKETLRLPRFNYCLHVAQDCLETVDAHAAGKPTETPNYPAPYLVVAVIDGNFVDHSGPDDWNQFPPFDGCTQKYVGWQYTPVGSVPNFYNEHHYWTMESDVEYIRPPMIAPMGLGVMPLAKKEQRSIPSK
ncbi:hypothetical protein PGQ11_009062 [Apiospora arundinis]|uniref:Uncharacterized protein n=1 Tax=Apiospora arundinis TaxID=335852 RepID=A0ABR2IHL0_9PEZI